MRLFKFIVNSFTESSISLVHSTMQVIKPQTRKSENSGRIAFPSTEESGDAFFKPLSTSFYSNLLRLEDKIQRKEFSENTINEIILHYAVIKIY